MFTSRKNSELLYDRKSNYLTKRILTQLKGLKESMRPETLIIVGPV